MKIIPNLPRTLATGFSIALTLASLVGGAQAQPASDPGPLPQTIDGQPIDSNQPEGAVLSYIDQQVQARIHVIPEVAHYDSSTGILLITSPARLVIPGDLGALVPIVVKFGTKNLASAHRAGATVRQGDLDDGMLAQLKAFEDSVIEQALPIAAQQGDISAVVDAAQDDDVDKNQTTLLMIVLQRAKATDARVNSLVIDKLGSTTGYGTSAMALYHFAITSPDLAVQKKMADSIHGLMNSNSFSTESLADSATNASTGADSAVNQLMIDAVTAQNAPCLAIFAEWVNARATEWKKEATGDTSSGIGPNDQLRSILGRLFDALSSHPATLAFAPVGQGLGTLMALLKRAPTYAAEYDFIAAACGNKTALQELLAGANPASTAMNLTLNGFPVPPGSQPPSYTRDLLQLIAYQGSGDKLAATLQDLDTAIYAQGQWTVTDSSAAKNATSSASPIAPTPAASPLASAPPPANVVPTAATPAAPPAPAGPVTATVTTATKIEAQTPSGGHASIPLDVGTQLTIVAVNDDGTVRAQTSFGFTGTVPKAALQFSGNKAP